MCVCVHVRICVHMCVYVFVFWVWVCVSVCVECVHMVVCVNGHTQYQSAGRTMTLLLIEGRKLGRLNLQNIEPQCIDGTPFPDPDLH